MTNVKEGYKILAIILSLKYTNVNALCFYI